MISQNTRGTRKQTGKPVNINISFTINPKNILNNPSINNPFQGRKLLKDNDYVGLYDSARTPNCSRTPDPQGQLKIREHNNNNEPIKNRRNVKRSSVDQTTFRETKLVDINKSMTLKKFAATSHVRKSSTKSKKCSDNSARKHNKTASNFTRNIDKYQASSVIVEGGYTTNHKTNLQKNLKKMINHIITNQLSKRSLPIQLPNNVVVHQRTSQKKKKTKSPKKGNKSQSMLNSDWANPIDRQKLIQKLTSFRSMNNSLFISEPDQQINPKDRKSIVVNTDQSIQCIDQIHELQVSDRYRQLDKPHESIQKTKNTIDLIQTYIALLNQNIQYQGQIHPVQKQQKQEKKENKMIGEQFQIFREQKMRQKQIQQFSKQIQYAIQQQQLIQIAQKPQKHKHKHKGDELKPFCSSQMTKQQQLINQLQRIKLHELKKHQVQKWQQLLIFMKRSMQNGQADSQQILENVYNFLQRTRNDLQSQLEKPEQQQQKQQSQIDAFTNQLASSQEHTLHKDNRQLLEHKVIDNNNNSNDNNNDNQHQFDQISSMSYKDEDYQQQNQQLKIVNLQMIDSALKARYTSLVERNQKQLIILEQKRNSSKISQIDFILQKDKLQKWTKQQTTAINHARKNIWKGYSEAKGILQKSAQSKLFQQQFQSGKKKSMMKCLSQDYLLKKNITLLKVDRKQQEMNSKQFRRGDHHHIQKQQKKIQNKQQQQQQQQHQQQYDDSEKQQKSEILNSDKDILSYQQQQQQYNREGQIIINNKQTIQLNQLKNQQDIEIIKQRLLDIKQKRLKEDQLQQNSPGQSPNMSYEQVPKQLHQSYSDEQMNIMRNQFSDNQQAQPLKAAFDKLKYVCAEDKEDIFQFIFLDLSIQIYQETCHENRIMNAVNKYVTNAKKQATKKKGVKTNLNVIKQYLRRFTGYILRTNRNILQAIDQPVGPTAIEMLRYMHENDEDEPREQEQTPSTLIIPATVFDQFEKQLLPSVQFEVYYQHDEQRQNKRVQFLRSVLHIHNKALFDGLNEYLDTLRPFGIWGKPFPWKKATNFLRDSTSEQKQQKLKKGADKVSQYCSYVCGLLVDKQESLVGNAKLSEDYLEQIKQDRLSRMLATQLIDNEQRWLFYDDEETEVLVQLSSAFYRIMIKEAAHEIMLTINKQHRE